MKRSLVPVLSTAVLVVLGWSGSVAAQLTDAKLATLSLRGDRTSYAPGGAVALEAWVEVEPEWHVNSHTPTFDYLIPTRLVLELPAGIGVQRFEYPDHELQTFAFEEVPLAVYDGRFVIRAHFEVPASYRDTALPVRAELAYQACNQSQCVAPTKAEATTVLVIGAEGALVANAPPPSVAVKPAVTASTASETSAPAARGLFSILLLAFLGGVILNAMPCVLPVLSLKFLSLVEGASHGRKGTVYGALATTAGIFFSFWALALAAIAAKSAGSAVGWGVQFQNPAFVTGLLLVVTLFSLNLWGLFEIPLPQKLAQLGSQGPTEGLGGHFASGLFATLLATPCSAPFLGTALGFALSRPAGTILAVFTAVAVGLAAPYLLLAAVPGFARVLPRPGAWMLTLRGFLGFLLAATAVWLLYVLGGQVSRVHLAGVQLAVLALALCVWLVPRLRGSWARGLAWGGVVAAMVVAVALAAAPAEGDRSTLAKGAVTRLIPWEPFDRTRAETVAQAGQAVFVDVTADWCFTCKVIEGRVLETEPVAEAFRRHGVLPLRADWTNRDPGIAKFLEDHGRFGIPFYMLYRPGQEPRVFSELLTRETLLAAVAELPPA
ncbi:MAG: thioredoxin family protein [Thermoanaerobaculia bacterium]|nr:thioredoxin family protein [Thermoanaerobaculia bacterium]